MIYDYQYQEVNVNIVQSIIEQSNNHYKMIKTFKRWSSKSRTVCVREKVSNENQLNNFVINSFFTASQSHPNPSSYFEIILSKALDRISSRLWPRKILTGSLFSLHFLQKIKFRVRTQFFNMHRRYSIHVWHFFKGELSHFRLSASIFKWNGRQNNVALPSSSYI